MGPATTRGAACAFNRKRLHPVAHDREGGEEIGTILTVSRSPLPRSCHSFGIDNVHIGPPASETWPTVDNFDGGSTQGWSGYPANELVT